MYLMKNAVAKISRMRNNAKYWIDKLGLQSHPEGGHYKEVYRSDELIEKKALPERYSGNRAFSTSIYYLLQKGEKSAFHRIKSDETWYFHDGSELEIAIIDSTGSFSKKLLGLDIEKGCLPQLTIKHGSWFGAKTNGEFTLVGCNVAPGFDFADFEMGNFPEMLDQFPQHGNILKEFCVVTSYFD